MKKVLSLLLALVCVVSLLGGVGVSAYAEETVATSGSSQNVSWEFNRATGTLTVTGNGAMADYSFDTTPFKPYREIVQEVVFVGNITHIGAYAFSGFRGWTNVGAVTPEIVLPNTVKSIGGGAFYQTYANVVIPKSVTRIDGPTFVESARVYSKTYAETYCIAYDIPYQLLDGQITWFVRELYKNFLNRAADPAGENDWVAKLESGQVTGAQAVKGFVESPEYGLKGQTNENFVKAMYAVVLGRVVEETDYGYQFWVGLLRAGVSKDLLIRGFVNSVEFATRCYNMAIKPGSVAAKGILDQNFNVTAFVARLYQTALRREADKAGMEYWVGALLDGSKTAGDVARGFFYSVEIENALAKGAKGEEGGLTWGDFVETCYQTLLNRPSDPEGLAYWTNILNDGAIYPTEHVVKDFRTEVVEGFIASPEFANLCKLYGIAR